MDKTIEAMTCSRRRCEAECAVARAALAEAFSREVALVQRFDAMVDNADHSHRPVLAREVNEVLQARDWALARLDEWSV